MNEQELWEKCVAFHGHSCGGLGIGFYASLCAIELLGLDFSQDENVVCVSENDACGVDAIQVLLGCSVGKGNLLFHMRGKQAFNFFERTSGKAIRLLLRPLPASVKKGESLSYYRSKRPDQLFDVSEPTVTLPERARHFTSVKCSCCGEVTGQNWLRPCGDELLCLDCFQEYDRFRV